MNMYKLICVPVFLYSLLLLPGCEQPSDVSEFPYEAKVVVNCVIQAGRAIDKIHISRTLPIPVDYSDEFADIRNASVAIQTDDTLIVYKYTDRFTYSNSGLIAKQGKTYTLLVQWEDKFATATTTVPRIGVASAPSMKSIVVSGKEEKYLETQVQPKEKEAYLCTWMCYYNIGTLAGEAQRFSEISASGQGEKVIVRSEPLPSTLLGSGFKYGLRLHIYDPQYKEYYLSQTDNQVSGNIYLRTNTNIKWNVRGDGIGMFIAKADTLLRAF